jgi:hypothetical protein
LVFDSLKWSCSFISCVIAAKFTGGVPENSKKNLKSYKHLDFGKPLYEVNVNIVWQYCGHYPRNY